MNIIWTTHDSWMMLWMLVGIWAVIGTQVLCGFEPGEMELSKNATITILQQLFIILMLGPIVWVFYDLAAVLIIIGKLIRALYRMIPNKNKPVLDALDNRKEA
jgi:uncharacterized membrane protein